MSGGCGDAEGGSGDGTVGDARSRPRGGQRRVRGLRSWCPRRGGAPVRDSGGRGGETLRGAWGEARLQRRGGGEGREAPARRDQAGSPRSPRERGRKG